MSLPAGFLSYSNPGDLTKKKGLSNALGQTLGQQQALEQQGIQDRSAEHGTLSSGYSDLINNPGGTPQEQAALTSSVLTPIRGAFNTARSQAGRHVAATGNDAGYSSALGQIAREEGQQSAQAGFGLANEMYQRKMQAKLAGLQGLAGMYGVDTSYLSNLGSQEQGTLGLGNSVESRRKGILGTIGGIVGIGAGVKSLLTPGLQGKV
jgi:hypothetical protein